MLIGENNMFEIGSQFAGTSIGNNNILGQKAVVGENVQLSNGCVIGPRCELLQNGTLAERTCIYGDNNERRTMHDSPPVRITLPVNPIIYTHFQSLQMHSKFLCGKLYKFGHAFRNKT